MNTYQSIIHRLFKGQKAKITSSDVLGILKPEKGSSITVRCTAIGDKAADIRWIAAHADVTDKSTGTTHRGRLISSQLQVNFTSASEIISNYKCKEIKGFQLKCRNIVTCQTARGNVIDDTKDHNVEITIGKKTA